MADEPMRFMIEDARLIFRNFAGKEGKFNQEGQRSFAVILDDETARVMEKDGWNVRYLEPREEGEEPTPYITVAVNFKVKPPRITIITSTARTVLTEENVAILDWADIRTCDLVANASFWEVNGKTGIKAYLKTMFVTIEEDELERKYSTLEES